MILQITSYGNGALLTKVIMGVSYILTNKNYLELIQLVVILAGVVGLIVAHKENVAGGSVGLKLIGTLAIAAVIWSSFYLPQDTVIVYDPVNNYQTSVKNVPVPLALPMYLENSIGDGLASLYDAYMGSSGFPSSMSYNNTGFNWGSIATNQLQSVNFVNPYDQMTINSYLVNCYFPAVQLGHASILDLYNSNNILQTLQQGSQTSNAFLAEIYNTSYPGGNGVDCNTAYNYITGMVNATTSTGSAAQSYAATLDGKTQAHGLTLTQVMGNLSPAADFLLNTGLNSQQLISQMALANSLSPAFQRFSAKFGVPDNNLSFGVAQTEYQQQTVWTQTAFMARIFLPILHFIMEAIIFGSFPLIFLMTLIPGFSKKAFGYIMSMLMWLAFWAPLMSILNGLSAWLLSIYAFPLNVTGGNVNLNDMGYIFHSLRQWAAMIGSMSMAVPMLAYGLATMSNFVGMEVVAAASGAISGGINTAAQSVATESGAQAMQSQAQNMMQNQANKAYTDPSQFDGIMENNAESVAAQRQAMSDFIHRRGMGNAANADLAGMNYQYGVNSTLGANAEHIGGLAAKNQMGTLQGLDNYAHSQGLNMEQIAAINSEYGGFSTLNKAKGTEAGLGGHLTSGTVNAEQTGIDSFNSAKVNDMLKLYQKDGMTSTQAASQIAYTNGIAVAVKNGKETEIFGSNGKVAMVTGSTVQNGFSENWVKDGKGQTIWTSRSAGMDTTNGHFTKKGDLIDNYNNRVKNTSGTSTDNHHRNKTSFYGHKFDIPSQYSTSAGYGGLNATPELKPFIDEGLSGKNYNTTTALGAFVGNGVGQFFTNNSGFQNSSANNVKTALETGIRAEMSSPGMKLTGDGVKGFVQLTQGYSHDIKSATTKDQMLNRTAMYFQGVTHLLAKDKNLTPEQKTAELNSFTKAFETTTMQNLSPYTSASNIGKRVNALPTATKFKIGKGVYKKDTAGGKAVTETQYLKDIKTSEENYVKSKEQGVIDNKIKNSVDDRFVK